MKTVLSGGFRGGGLLWLFFSCFLVTAASRASLTVNQSSAGYTAPGSLTVDCEVVNGTGDALLSFLWLPAFPPGWTLSSVMGPGAPEISSNQIVFTATSLPVSTFTFNYTLVTDGTFEDPVEIGGEFEFQQFGMENPVRQAAANNPIFVHSFLQFTVQSERGDTQPPVGTHPMSYARNFQAQVLTPVVETNGARYSCAGWIMNGNEPSSGAAASFNLILTNDAVLKWEWDTDYYLDMQASAGGSVTPASGWYPADNHVTVEAVPDADHKFVRWTGTLITNAPSFNVYMDRTHSLLAVFEPLIPLEVFSSYGNPEPPVGITYFSNNAMVTASVPDSPVPGGTGKRYVCDGWLGQGSVPSIGTNESVTFQMQAVSRIEWLWETQYYLDIGTATGGSVLEPSGWYDATLPVTLTAQPDEGFRFVQWNGDVSGTNNPVTFNIYSPSQAIPVFEPVQHLITATAGTGGTVLPIGESFVEHGQSIQYLIEPFTDYHVLDVLVDGSSVGVVTQYTFSNVTTSHTIHAEFSQSLVQMQVISEHGATTPAPGTYFPVMGTLFEVRLNDTVIVDGSRTQYHSVGWTGAGSAPSGTGTSVVFEINLPSSVTWLWETKVLLQAGAQNGGGVEGELPGFKPQHSPVSVQAVPWPGFEFYRWSGDVPSEKLFENPLEITMDVARDVQAQFRVDPAEIYCELTCAGYRAPGIAQFQAAFHYPAGETLHELEWLTGLPGTDWLVKAVSGHGDPYVDGSTIRFTSSALVENPIVFTYEVDVPAQPLGSYSNIINSRAVFRLGTMTAPIQIRPQPEPFHIRRLHAADYRPPFWQIDNTEINRVLAYWRAGGYRPSTIGYDGFAPTASPDPGDQPGVLHSADYLSPERVINADEANTALSLWRAGHYYLNPGEIGGYSPGVSGGMVIKRTVQEPMVVSLSAPGTYVAGESFDLAVEARMPADPLGICWVAELPEGWVIESVSGDGQPELRCNEVLWTGTLPEGDVTFTCRVGVPAEAEGPQELDGRFRLYTRSRRGAGDYRTQDGPLLIAPEGQAKAPVPADGPRITTIRFEEPDRVVLGWEGGPEGHYGIYQAEKLDNSVRRRGTRVNTRVDSPDGQGALVPLENRPVSGFFWLQLERE